jgi:hypothetical protein
MSALGTGRICLQAIETPTLHLLPLALNIPPQAPLLPVAVGYLISLFPPSHWPTLC